VFNITGYTKDVITHELASSNVVHNYDPNFPIHLAVPFLKMGDNEGDVIVDNPPNSITQHLTSPFNNDIIFKLLKQLNVWSIFIIMTFSYLVAFMVSYIAITIETN